MMALGVPEAFAHEVTISVDKYNAAQEWTFRNVNECYYRSKGDETGRVFLIYNFSTSKDALMFKLKFS